MHLPKHFREEECFASCYNEAIALKIREGAPLASYAIDRRCLRKAAEATAGEAMQVLICFFCACVYTRAGACKLRDIDWYTPLENPEYFLGCTASQARELFSLDTYLEKYGESWKSASQRPKTASFLI